ncbi:ABC transporter ATP-binding protein [Aestuariibacter salexigens]|uniref:ABC transporter ATP-binding protein n=1 Tax=Aestuariibacter salexigens TaxID=226010 RepID=UPI000414773D|nr:ABC transporter ATP-binding protein [Aestuariibacter salexigens]
MIKVSGVCKRYAQGQRTQQVLNNLNLDLAKGESAAILGASGCGKSTLLNLLAVLETPDSGNIQVAGQHVTQFNEGEADNYRRQHVGIVFQRFNLIQGLDVWDNVCFPARLNNNLDADYVDSLLHRLGLTDKRHAAVEQLSGGEQQRVAIVRALAHKPLLVLADEPTGNLDEHNSTLVTELLYQLCEDTDTTLIIVTHSQVVAGRARHRYTLSQGKLHLLP